MKHYKRRRHTTHRRTKRSFGKTAMRTKTRNYRTSSMRGGYRL